MRILETGYKARPQFASFHARKQRWGIGVCHVRAGKTVAAINDLIHTALTCELPNPRCAYMAPLFAQAKDVAWTYLKEYTRVIPGIGVNESELRVDFPNGGRVRLYGADNYQRLSGIYLDDVCLDEFGDMDPRAWKEVVRARLSDRNGRAMFIGTPKGNNHFAELWTAAQSDPDWFTLKLRASETGILPQHELDSARRSMTEEDYQAQYEASFEASVVGTIFGRQMDQAAKEGRICGVPWQPEFPVSTWWDIGTGDPTAIWFTQDVGREVHVIDYYENNGVGVGIDHYIRHLQGYPYIWGTHNGPHDLEAHSFAAGGKSAFDVARSLGFHFEVVPRVSKSDGINAARNFMQRCWFDKAKTELGRQALVNYHYTWDERRKVFSAEPYHSWDSNASDAFRYLAVGHKTTRARNTAQPSMRISTLGAGQQAWMGS